MHILLSEPQSSVRTIHLDQRSSVIQQMHCCNGKIEHFDVSGVSDDADIALANSEQHSAWTLSRLMSVVVQAPGRDPVILYQCLRLSILWALLYEMTVPLPDQDF